MVHSEMLPTTKALACSLCRLAFLPGQIQYWINGHRWKEFDKTPVMHGGCFTQYARNRSGVWAFSDVRTKGESKDAPNPPSSLVCGICDKPVEGMAQAQVNVGFGHPHCVKQKAEAEAKAARDREKTEAEAKVHRLVVHRGLTGQLSVAYLTDRCQFAEPIKHVLHQCELTPNGTHDLMVKSVAVKIAEIVGSEDIAVRYRFKGDQLPVLTQSVLFCRKGRFESDPTLWMEFLQACPR